ncbi:DUF2177 family protein [Ancylobacter pratisalsi]|uniref:DUF2177 family protein n=2 Tax=Ancylobacter pratisalsi TaxID=1745854 RepID=A0A6P1YSL7_9HYPH|nr:DUF2177 family protein [Ancylobacter pratisalsi]
MRYLVSYLATGLVMLAIDAVWLGLMTSRLYRPRLGDMLAETPNLAPAVLFYLIYVGGIVVFAVQPALASGRWTTALLFGALLGLVAYSTYDLTNQATLRQWSTLVTAADMIWGTVLTGVSATAGMLITQALMGRQAP